MYKKGDSMNNLKNDSLDTYEFLFAVEHGLPISKSAYTDVELLALKEKALKQKIKDLTKIEKRKRALLFNEKK